MTQTTFFVGLMVFVCLSGYVSLTEIPLPSFADLKANYPGFYHHGGPFRNNKVIRLLGVDDSKSLLLHDTSALRLSYTLNKIGNQHSLGSDVIRLSKYGTDSVTGKNGLQYIFHPLAFGPYLADKYGYPSVTKMHLFDPEKTVESFRNKQGIMRVITYKQHDNEPTGHVGLWDCDGFFTAKDFFKGHTLLSVEFWESPDTDCSPRHKAIPKPTQETDLKSVGIEEAPTKSRILSLITRHAHRKHKNGK